MQKKKKKQMKEEKEKEAEEEKIRRMKKQKEKTSKRMMIKDQDAEDEERMKKEKKDEKQAYIIRIMMHPHNNKDIIIKTQKRYSKLRSTVMLLHITCVQLPHCNQHTSICILNMESVFNNVAGQPNERLVSSEVNFYRYPLRSV